MTQPREALVVEDLHKSFGGLEVLKGISMTAHEHDVVSILGSSGSGKSTLLRSPGRWRWSRRCCSSTSRRRPSIRSS